MSKTIEINCHANEPREPFILEAVVDKIESFYFKDIGEYLTDGSKTFGKPFFVPMIQIGGVSWRVKDKDELNRIKEIVKWI